MDYNELIIERPSLQSLKQKYGYGMITFLFWSLWFYLWQPLLSLVAWSLGVKFFYDKLIALCKVLELIQMIALYLFIIIIIGFIFLGWAQYNNLKFRNKKRRGLLWKVSMDNVAERYELDVDQVVFAKASRKLVVHFDDLGKIVRLSNKHEA